mmetsp:Transcript_9351/g.15539  ORF Transcript_9351/g.15539 Transcript_9351/m.15539 type:complete len:272 (-) Transcript_9351:70-885(-)
MLLSHFLLNCSGPTSCLNSFHGNLLAMPALLAELFLRILSPDRDLGQVLLPQLVFFINVLLLLFFRSPLPHGGEHARNFSIVHVRVLFLDFGSPGMRVGKKRRHGSLGGIGVLLRLFLRRNLPGARVERLLNFEASLILPRKFLPSFSLFGVQLFPCHRHELGNVCRLLHNTSRTEFFSDFFVFTSREEHVRRLEPPWRLRRFLVLGFVLLRHLLHRRTFKMLHWSTIRSYCIAWIHVTHVAALLCDRSSLIDAQRLFQRIDEYESRVHYQ